MNNAIYKIQMYFGFSEIFSKRTKISLFKIKLQNELFNKLKVTKIKIDNMELKSRYVLFKPNKELRWEFSLKNWS